MQQKCLYAMEIVAYFIPNYLSDMKRKKPERTEWIGTHCENSLNNLMTDLLCVAFISSNNFLFGPGCV